MVDLVASQLQVLQMSGEPGYTWLTRELGDLHVPRKESVGEGTCCLAGVAARIQMPAGLQGEA